VGLFIITEIILKNYHLSRGNFTNTQFYKTRAPVFSIQVPCKKQPEGWICYPIFPRQRIVKLIRFAYPNTVIVILISVYHVYLQHKKGIPAAEVWTYERSDLPKDWSFIVFIQEVIAGMPFNFIKSLFH